MPRLVHERAKLFTKSLHAFTVLWQTFSRRMKHLLEMLKIIEGGLSSDRAKVLAYGDQLAAKLASEGEARAAEALRRVLSASTPRHASAAGVAPSLPVDGESRMPLADVVFVKRGDAPVILPRGTSAEVAEFLSHIRCSDLLLAGGVSLSPSMLMFGPPGCGKTQLAKHIASELELPLVTARADSLISSYLGSTAKNLRLLFEHARNRPCVLFLDEFDSVAKLRDDRHELGELKRVVVSLLQNLDALDNSTIVIAATNHEHLLDTAIWRRFGYRLRVTLPDTEARRQLAELFLADQRPEDAPLELIAEITDGLSGADLRAICEDARRIALLGRRERVDGAELLRRIAKYRVPSLHALPVPEQLRRVRALDPKLYTIRRLSEMFGVSTVKVSNLLREGSDQ